MGLSEDELAFYDAITRDEKIFEKMKDEKLIQIVKDLSDTIRKNISIDWYDKESVQAKMRSSIRRLFKKIWLSSRNNRRCHRNGFRTSKSM